MGNSCVSKIVGIGDIYLETIIINQLVLKVSDMFQIFVSIEYPQANLMMRYSQILLMKGNASSPKVL